MPNPVNDDEVDAAAESAIASCLDLDKPSSFFLFAGAGSGKTRSLVEGLKAIQLHHGKRMQLRGQQVAVITYTNNASDEIKRRLDFDPLIQVSTIHSFIWDLIEGFDKDIRDWLRTSITAEIQQLNADQKKGRAASQAARDRERDLAFLHKRLGALDGIKKFIYSPTGENRTRDSLNHAEVIKLGAFFLTSKPLMQDLLVCRFPILLIDESQDTNKLLMEAFFVVQNAQKARFCLGLLGDTMQRIYSDGKIDLGFSLPPDWKTPAKVMNHRSPKRVIRLVNKIRSDVDSHQQRARSDAKEGLARLFITSSVAKNKQLTEQDVRKKMALLSGDAEWENPDQVKTLILEHHMAASRLGFSEMFAALHPVEEFKTGLREGTLPIVRIFSDLALPLVKAKRSGNEFIAAGFVRADSPLLSKEAFDIAGSDQLEQVAIANRAVTALMAIFDGKRPTFLEVLRVIAAHKLFEIPERLKSFAGEEDTNVVNGDGVEPEPETSPSKSLLAIRSFLETSFWQIEPYSAYVKGETAFATHQSIKGLQFPRVLVVMDDEEAAGFLFSFEKLFSVKPKTDGDLKNEQEGKETGIDRTRRLFYVTCSRSQQSLAVLAYSANPARVTEHALKAGWFEQPEIETIV